MTTGEILAIDIGSTAVKAGCFGLAGGAAGDTVSVRHRQGNSGAPVGHIDAQALLDATVRAVGSLDLAGVKVVATSTVWHALVAVDADNAPIGPGLSWEAAFSTELQQDLAARLDGVWSHRASGAYLHPSYSIVSMPMLAARRPHRISDIGSWIVSRLAGFIEAWPENIAAGSGLWRQDHREWNGPAIDALQVDRALIGNQWSSARRSVSPAVDALRGVTFLPPVGDGLCHNLGQHAVDGRVAITVGTSGSVRSVTCGPPFDGPGHGLWRYRCDARTSATGGAITSAGNTFEWVAGLFGAAIPWAAVTPDVVAALPHADGSIFGRRGPDYPWQASGSVSGITPDTRADDIALAWGLDVWRQFARHHTSLRDIHGAESELVVEGGVIDADPAAAQVLADALGTPVMRTTQPQPSLAGAAMVGATYLLTDAFSIDATVDLIRGTQFQEPGISATFGPRAEITDALRRRWTG